MPGDPVSRFFSSMVVAIDIIGSASLRGRPDLTADSKITSAMGGSALEIVGVTGCEPWVLRCISDTTRLRSWKREKVESQTLNVVELARRAIMLEQDLKDNVEEMDRRSSSSKYSTVSLLTHIYAAATKAYLHVVVSGANPEVEDISSAVHTAVEGLQKLRQASSVRRLGWPICVTASLAQSRHETFFGLLEAGARGDQDECNSVLRAFEVVRETKRLRRLSTGNERMIDWIDGMESLGREWILL